MVNFARGQFIVDYEHRINIDDLRSKRVEKAQLEMKKRGIDALFCTKVENVRYLSSLRASFLAHRESVGAAVLILQEGKPHLFTNGGEIP